MTLTWYVLSWSTVSIQRWKIRGLIPETHWLKMKPAVCFRSSSWLANKEDETRIYIVSCRRVVVQQHCDAWLPMKRQIHLTILIDGILVVIDSNIGPSFPKRAKSSNEKRFVFSRNEDWNDRSNRCCYF